MVSKPLTKKILPASLVFLSLALSGCAGYDATDATVHATAATDKIDETQPSEVPAPAPIPPAAPRGEFKIIKITGHITTIHASVGTDYIYEGDSDTHHFDVPAGAVSMTVDLVWMAWLVGPNLDVPGSDLALSAAGPGEGARKGRSDCTNYAPLPDPKGGPCNRDRSEQLVLEGLGVADVGQWHLDVYGSYPRGPSANAVVWNSYTATITFR